MEILIVLIIIALAILFLHSRTEEGQKPIIEKPNTEEIEKGSGFGGLLFLISFFLLIFGFFGFGASESIIDSATAFIVVVSGISLFGLAMFAGKVMPRFGLILFLACVVGVFFVIASIGGI